MAFAQLEPFGDAREDLRMGIVASVIANANRDPKKQKRPFTPKDFMVDFEGAWLRARQPKWLKLLGLVETLNAGFGGRDLRNRDA
jgi:hypothetical protein